MTDQEKLDQWVEKGPAPVKRWQGTPPSQCDGCSQPIVTGDDADEDAFWVDGATVYGPWANMCP
ncbi:MAG: hypothetical protein ACYSWP_12860, partial [Planctomycetota bacterium]